MTKKIEGNDVYTNTAGGQFITFSGDICFESTKEGSSVGNGSLSLDRVVNGNEIYKGSCYFGHQSEFKFSPDKSILNINPGNGIIYVYRRSTPTDDVTTCTLIRKNESTNSNSYSLPSSTYSTYNENAFIPQYVPNTTQPSGVSNSTPNTSSGTTYHFEHAKYGYKDCPVCYGSGKCPTCNGKGVVTNGGGFGLDAYKCHCNNGKCSNCNGTGKVYGRLD